MQIFIGILLASLIAVLAWRVGSLSTSGAWAAVITGGLIFGLGGLPWAILLLAFFITSSGLSRTFKQRKVILAEKYSKGDRRDWGQVLANGSLGALLAIGYFIPPHHAWIWMAYAGAMAAVNADTWSTELGVLSPVLPRMITSRQKVERGTSGGITLVGTLAALGGAGLIAALAVIFTPKQGWLTSLGIIIAGGIVGALIDSLLGATVQAIYWCPMCHKETERHPTHTCGSPTQQVRGWSWVNNDLVNFVCSLVGAMVSAGLYLLFQ
ncbi:MAG TPA: DUF92 domain-containing protein [Anaerolineales bacterium]|nr:DUF92 domain-containing protein [Anaerolineales bacterium]